MALSSDDLIELSHIMDYYISSIILKFYTIKKEMLTKRVMLGRSDRDIIMNLQETLQAR